MNKAALTKTLYGAIAKHFSAYATPQVPLFVEGQDLKAGDKAELRIDGPFISHPTKIEWYIDIEVNLLLTCDMEEEDAYKIWTLVGQYIEAFSDSIEVNGLGCLILQHDRGDDVILSNFGQVDPNLRVIQSSLNALYNIYITGLNEKEQAIVQTITMNQVIGKEVD